ncbi:hypothetical protein CLV65_1356 [Pseudoscardovia suis]|uniref:Uncharacterized protein n=1 Tax=Pseudoscardovia suis TaxID=987063 RepID=A0A261F4B0_9BIFI|nr:hypothetical protein PSSU_0070 [Pseudoscardovia suis]PJJ65794.1 hypothetical protein CLV65_1356 [Pseudoscardovia suis]
MTSDIQPQTCKRGATDVRIATGCALLFMDIVAGTFTELCTAKPQSAPRSIRGGVGRAASAQSCLPLTSWDQTLAS